MFLSELIKCSAELIKEYGDLEILDSEGCVVKDIRCRVFKKGYYEWHIMPGDKFAQINVFN